MSHPDISQYRPPRHRSGWLLVVAAVIVVGAVLVAGWRLARTPDIASTTPTPSATGAPTTSPVRVPTAVATSNSVPFQTSSGDAKGVWTITGTNWQGGQVVVSMTIRVTEGTLSDYSFFLMENDTAAVHRPTPGAADDMSTGTIEAGRTVHGTVTITSPHTAATLVLTLADDRDPVTALEVPA